MRLPCPASEITAEERHRLVEERLAQLGLSHIPHVALRSASMKYHLLVPVVPKLKIGSAVDQPPLSTTEYPVSTTDFTDSLQDAGSAQQGKNPYNPCHPRNPWLKNPCAENNFQFSSFNFQLDSGLPELVRLFTSHVPHNARQAVQQLEEWIDRLENATGEIASPHIDRLIEDIRLGYHDPASPLSWQQNPEYFKLCHRQFLITKQKGTIPTMINYRVSKCKSPKFPDTPYYSGKAVKSGEYTFENLATDINNSTTVTKADAMAVLASIKPYITKALLGAIGASAVI